MWDSNCLEILTQKREASKEGGGQKRIDTQHAKGKLSVWERINYLFDTDSSQEVGAFVESRASDFGMDKKRLPGNGVVTGFGTINGEPVYVAAEDFTVMGGTYAEYHSKKIVHIMDLALQAKAPFIAINDSGGARLEEGICGLDGYGDMFLRHTRASGKIPQIAVMGAEGAVGIMYRHELEAVANPLDKEKLKEEKIAEYNDKFMFPYIAAKLGIIDEVISPEETRRKIKTAFDSLSSKERSSLSYCHGNVPL